jgi:hypothetical protein
MLLHASAYCACACETLNPAVDTTNSVFLPCHSDLHTHAMHNYHAYHISTILTARSYTQGKTVLKKEILNHHRATRLYPSPPRTDLIYRYE